MRQTHHLMHVYKKQLHEISNHFILILLLFFSSFSWAQHSISGIIKDATTQEPLPFASVITDSNVGTVSDIDGKFELTSRKPIQFIKIEYLGYQTQQIDSDGKKYFKVNLQENTQSLNEVVVVAKENPALRIIRNTINKKPENNPEKALNSFKFTSYSKLVVTANPDSIESSVDSVYTKKDGKLVFKRVDSTNYYLKKDLTRSHYYMAEKIFRRSIHQTEREKRDSFSYTNGRFTKSDL